MKHHTLTLNWDGDNFRPDAEVLRVHTGDTISFRLGTAPPHSRFKITMNDPQFFSVAEVSDSRTHVHVLKAASTTLTCQLFTADGTLLSQDGQSGSQVEPADSMHA